MKEKDAIKRTAKFFNIAPLTFSVLLLAFLESIDSQQSVERLIEKLKEMPLLDV